MENRTTPEGEPAPRFFVSGTKHASTYIADRESPRYGNFVVVLHNNDAEFVCAALNAAHEREKVAG